MNSIEVNDCIETIKGLLNSGKTNGKEKVVLKQIIAWLEEEMLLEDDLK